MWEAVLFMSSSHWRGVPSGVWFSLWLQNLQFSFTENELLLWRAKVTLDHHFPKPNWLVISARASTFFFFLINSDRIRIRNVRWLILGLKDPEEGFYAEVDIRTFTNSDFSSKSGRWLCSLYQTPQREVPTSRENNSSKNSNVDFLWLVRSVPYLLIYYVEFGAHLFCHLSLWIGCSVHQLPSFIEYCCLPSVHFLLQVLVGWYWLIFFFFFAIDFSPLQTSIIISNIIIKSTIGGPSNFMDSTMSVAWTAEVACAVRWMADRWMLNFPQDQ